MISNDRCYPSSNIIDSSFILSNNHGRNQTLFLYLETASSITVFIEANPGRWEVRTSFDFTAPLCTYTRLPSVHPKCTDSTTSHKCVFWKCSSSSKRVHFKSCTSYVPPLTWENTTSKGVADTQNKWT